MAEEKVNRNNHPILVKAREASYKHGWAVGKREGYDEGYGNKCDEIHRYYRIIINALERRVEALNIILREDNFAYSKGYREGFKAAKEDIRYTVGEMNRMLDGILGEVDT
jgi:flagellar biosynthesis/type III secretory pathway protein FliH